MLKKTILFLAAVLVLTPQVSADTPGLYDWAFNINGVLYEHFGADVKPAHTGSFDWTTGLGTLNFLMTGTGPQYFAVFFDHEIDAALNTYLNEYGSVHGAPAAGQTWEIDEPGWASGYFPPGPIWGDIYGHVISDPPALENLNSVFSASPYDVSWALAWNFIIPSGKEAIVSLRVAETAPTSGFYLRQTDAGTLATIFFSGAVTLRDSDYVIPEPGSWLLLGTVAALLGYPMWRKRRVG